MKQNSFLKNIEKNDVVEISKGWGLDLKDEIISVSKMGELTTQLKTEFKNEDKFKELYRQFSEKEREAFLYIAINGGSLERKEVVNIVFKNNEKDFNSCFENLAKKGFVYDDKKFSMEVNEDIISIPSEFTEYLKLPFYYNFFLGNLLWELPTTSLKKIGIDGLNLSGKTFTQRSLIYSIRKKLLEPYFLSNHIENLQTNEKDIFKLLIRKGGVCIYRELLDVGYQRRYDHSKADFVNSLLNFSGLVFTAHKMENKYNNLLIIPRDIQNIIKNDFQQESLDLKDLDTISLTKQLDYPTTVLDNTYSFLRDIITFASFINRNNVRQLSNGGVGKNDLKKVLPFLSAYKTVKYAGFIALFCIKNQLMVGVGDNWKIDNTFDEWLEKPEDCYKDIVNFWMNTNEWNEEFIEGNVIHAEVPPANLTNVTELRKLVLQNFETIPFNQWISFSRFYEMLIPQIDVFIPKKSPSSTSGRFNRGLKLTLESIIAETLYWLGFVTIGLSNSKAVEFLGRRESSKLAAMKGNVQKTKIKESDLEFYFKLNTLSKFFVSTSYLLDADNSSAHESRRKPISFEADTFIVQPNLEIITPPDLNLTKFYKILEFTEIKSMDVMTTLYISKESVRQGMDRGMRGEDMLEFLEESCKQKLPDTVKHLITECTDKHGEVNVGYCGGYIIVEDPVLVQELKSHKKIKSAIKDIFNDRIIILNQHIDVKKMAKELQRLGFMPHLESETIHLSTEGIYNLTLKTEELYNLVALLMIIDKIEQEVDFHFTEDKVTALLEKLNPESKKDYNITYYADNISKNIFKKYMLASKKKTSEITDNYKLQIKNLMGSSQAINSELSFKGPNPATDPKDVKELLKFAVEHEMPIELIYKKVDNSTTTLNLKPESMESVGVYAYDEDSDTYNIYKFKQIIKAFLI